MKISVCMAAFNGAKYIKRQLSSILNQLGPNDQLIVVDDCSSDDTVKIINSFKDVRIQLYLNEVNVGAGRTFDRALHLADGDLIFLSDQDDRWFDNKISFISKTFSTQEVDLIVHDAVIVKGSQIISPSLFKIKSSSTGIVKNIIHNSYTGCCMAFNKDILGKVLPISPQIGIYHDAWIGILAECYGYKTAFVRVPLIEFNRHDENASAMKRRNLIYGLTERIVLILSLLNHLIRKFIL
ncbi:MAG: family 2 glycosyl transferase [Chitinophagaceae bacterium]|nr:MAG: family 2 glycosyl transferase [Chitinophagaceae bacterium]